MSSMVRLALPLFVSLAVAAPVTAADPHFIVLPGIEGPSPCARGIIAGLRKSYPAATFEVYDWTTGHAYRMLYHVRGWDRNRVVAGQLAQHIVALQAERPDRPLILVGHSGGGAMSVLALEQLPPGVQIQQAILLAPDLSPTHPLTTALDRTVHGIDVFHSPLDCVILGAATVAVGTVDRAHLPGAGMTGFITRSADRDAYAAKLHQHGYEVGMAASGHFGGHFTCTLPDFVNHYVSPVVR
jgi:pimeloyl-ACP methyl ester carboxylesterase